MPAVHQPGELVVQGLVAQFGEFVEDMLAAAGGLVQAGGILLLLLRQEIPHSIAVVIETMKEREGEHGPILDIEANIFCEKDSHKGIIIGKHGAMLKRISSLARRDIEKFMGAKVYMETWVKVKENWRDNVNFIRSQGYNEQ
mgnify:CR=1 FL=1